MSQKKKGFIQSFKSTISKLNSMDLDKKLTLLFTLALVIVGILQLNTYVQQSKIGENSNILSQYEYRFEFYQKLSDLQKEISVVEFKPSTSLTEDEEKEEVYKLRETTYVIIALTRESKMLFDERLSDKINKILDEHLVFITSNHNNPYSQDEYSAEIEKLISEYGDFLKSEEFLKYLDIKNIK